MNYQLFCHILNDSLIFEPTPLVTPDVWEEWQQEFYTDFKEHSVSRDASLSDKEKVTQWVRDAFSEYSFDTHNFQLKPEFIQP
jgi:hypothetical protein